MSDWDPGQYERFKRERSLPFFDLKSLVVPAEKMRVIDLGCGTGELTRTLADDLDAALTLGLDSSAAMLAKGAAFSSDRVRFVRGDIARVTSEHPGPWDLVFSNAALHWLPDLHAIVRDLTRIVAPKGQLAVQVPLNFDHASHTTAAEIAREEPFNTELEGYTRSSAMAAPESIAELLFELGYVEQRVRIEVYAHVMPRREDVVEWVKGTLLTDYEKRMSAASFTAFLARYRERLVPRLGERDPYLFPFKRLLFWGRR